MLLQAEVDPGEPRDGRLSSLTHAHTREHAHQRTHTHAHKHTKRTRTDRQARTHEPSKSVSLICELNVAQFCLRVLNGNFVQFSLLDYEVQPPFRQLG